MRNILLAIIGAVLVWGSPAFGEAAPAERLEVVYASPQAEAALSITQPMFRPVGNFMMMNVKARNVSAAPARFEYKVDWYDETGFPLKGVGGWQTLILSPNQEEDLRVAGQTRGAYRARLTVR